MASPLRAIPSVHQLVECSDLQPALGRFGRTVVTAHCRAVVAELRDRILREGLDTAAAAAAAAELPAVVTGRLEAELEPLYPPVINATGVLLHTNLGRAPLPSLPGRSLASYLALEYDLKAGRRGQRLAPLEHRLAEVLGSEAGVMVNNNAAALLLLLTAHAHGREVIVSRGQLIEIGGSFRLPEVMAASGARLVEVGATNRTRVADYERAIGPDTAAILVAHHSNFRMVGFASEPAVGELAELARARDLALFVDQGSGALHDLARWGLEHEPTVGELLDQGAHAVCFSGDKLLGGPQAGIVVGARRWVEPLARHPLFRALRPDKTALLTMEQVLDAHRCGRLEEIPLYRLLGTPAATLRRRARAIARRLASDGLPATATATRATLGGGTTPGDTIDSHAVVLGCGQALADALRQGRPRVVARLEDDRVVLDLRAVFPGEDRLLEQAVRAALEPAPP